VARTSAPKTGTPKADALTALAGKTIVRLKITLRGIKPPIWRRLLIPAAMTLGDLHMAIQAAMGWEGDHLHVFDVGGRRYGDRESVDYVADENRITLNGLMKSGVNRFTYTYDFGDDWEHAVAIEKIEPALEGLSIRSASPENAPVRLKIAADPGATRTSCKFWLTPPPDHAERKEWLGDDLSPDHFDPIAANAILAARFGRI
jgi:Plasmid pRiA4b ORF-3-like protein